MKKILTITCLAGLALTACNGRDKAKPELTLSAPADSTVVQAGGTLDVTAQVSDDKELSQLKIDIHNAYDGHGHVKTEYVPFSMIQIENLAGTEAEKTISIPIPDSAGAGPYHCLVQAVDAAGNLSEYQLRVFTIHNADDDQPPVLNVSTPSDGFSTALGNDISISGDGSDNIALRKVDYYITRQGSDNKLAQDSQVLSGTSGTFSFNVPTSGISWSKGTYSLRLVLYDDVYNVDVQTITINLN